MDDKDAEEINKLLFLYGRENLIMMNAYIQVGHFFVFRRKKRYTEL